MPIRSTRQKRKCAIVVVDFADLINKKDTAQQDAAQQDAAQQDAAQKDTPKCTMEDIVFYVPAAAWKAHSFNLDSERPHALSKSFDDILRIRVSADQVLKTLHDKSQDIVLFCEQRKDDVVDQIEQYLSQTRARYHLHMMCMMASTILEQQCAAHDNVHPVVYWLSDYAQFLSKLVLKRFNTYHSDSLQRQIDILVATRLLSTACNHNVPSMQTTVPDILPKTTSTKLSAHPCLCFLHLEHVAATEDVYCAVNVLPCFQAYKAMDHADGDRATYQYVQLAPKGDQCQPSCCVADTAPPTGAGISFEGGMSKTNNVVVAVLLPVDLENDSLALSYLRGLSQVDKLRPLINDDYLLMGPTPTFETLAKVCFKPRTFCICNLPFDEERHYVQCGSCGEWLHPECLVPKSEVQALLDMVTSTDDDYQCPNCKRADNSSPSGSSSSASGSSSSASSTMSLTRIPKSPADSLTEKVEKPVKKEAVEKKMCANRKRHSVVHTGQTPKRGPPPMSRRVNNVTKGISKSKQLKGGKPPSMTKPTLVIGLGQDGKKLATTYE